MWPLRRQIPWSIIRRRLTAGVALVSQFVAICGVPFPAVASKNAGPAYPCQELACGCESAEECWKGCCCLTPEQRWAWARKHNVEPPEYAERPGKLSNNASKQAPAKPLPPCCAKNHKEQGAPNATSGLRWAVGLSAKRCQGVESSWIGAGTAIPPAPVLICSADAIALDWILQFVDVETVLPAVPPDPPPRLQIA
jgi:hypothetical protein